MKVLRNMVVIDEEKCNGCGLCVTACHEGAIVMVNGKAKLIREDYCDGLGDCLPSCPVGALTVERRVALPYDEAAVEAAMKAKKQAEAQGVASDCSGPLPSPGCPGRAGRTLKGINFVSKRKTETTRQEGGSLRQWPVQIQLVSPQASFFENADLLIAADCSAFAYANFHEDFIAGRVCVIGCPKLDRVSYAEKLSAIFLHNNLRSVTLVRMQVPCCGGLEHACNVALQTLPQPLPFKVVTVTADGQIL